MEYEISSFLISFIAVMGMSIAFSSGDISLFLWFYVMTLIPILVRHRTFPKD